MRCNLFNSKKGDISQPFIFIFAIVAGALILTFLLWFARGHVRIESLKSSQEAAFYFDETLTLLSAGEDVYKSIDNPLKREYEISCGTLKVEEGKPAKLNSIVFSPKQLSANKLSIYSKSILFPFKIANIYIISDPSKRYLFVYDERTKDLVESFKKDIRVKLPEVFNFQLISKQNLISTLNELTKQQITRFVLFTQLSQQDINKILQKFPTDILLIDYQDGSGNLKFISKTSTADSNFFSLPLLYAAIFSEDQNTYECSKAQLLNRLKLLSKFYSQKASLLNSAFTNCPYPQASGVLNSIDISTLESLKSFRISLEEVNNILAGGNCAPVY
ncbi:hypothetical protein HY498_05265 [Candidatus Woesearchaeota archaeon]|nr:hypothetical protein [Candidatus Woesearchaeota archaeon]